LKTLYGERSLAEQERSFRRSWAVHSSCIVDVSRIFCVNCIAQPVEKKKFSKTKRIVFYREIATYENNENSLHLNCLIVQRERERNTSAS